MFPKIKRRLASLVSVALTLTVLCSALPTSSGYAKSPISWSEERIEITLPPGGTGVRNVTFTGSRALQNIALEPVPEIAGFLSVEPGSFTDVPAGEQQSVQLSFSIPEGTSVGTYDGTVHVRSGNRTISQTLKVVIHVQEADATPEFILFNNPADPLLLRVETANGDVIEYFGEKDLNGLATALTSVSIREANGQVTRVLLDDQARPVQIIAFNGVVFSITWLSSTSILVSAISADGSVQVNVAVDLTQSGGTSTSALSSNHSSLLAAPTFGSSINRIRGTGEALEAVVSSRQKGFIASSNQATSLLPLSAAASASLVNVTRCGSPVNNADVALTVIPQSADAYTIPGTLVDSGQYSVPIPTTPSVGQSAEDLCESVAQVLSVGCEALKGIPIGAELLLCAQLAAAVSLIGTPAAGAAILAACETSFLALRLYCAVLGEGIPGGPSIGEILCGNVSEIVDRFTEGNLFIFPLVFVPGEGFIDTGDIGQSVSSSGPFPTFNIDAGGDVEVESFTTTPVDPAPFQSYIAEALIACAPPGTIVTISISGTDGYFDSASVTISGDANVTLTVPGAEEGIVDTITVQVSGGPTRQIVLVF